MERAAFSKGSSPFKKSHRRGLHDTRYCFEWPRSLRLHNSGTTFITVQSVDIISRPRNPISFSLFDSHLMFELLICFECKL